MGCAASTNQGSEKIIGTFKLKETATGSPDLRIKEDMLGFGASDYSKQTTGLALANYTILPSILRKDQYGDIRKVIHRPTGTARALKIVSQKVHGTEGIKRALLEAQIMSKLDHPNVAKLYEYFKKGSSLYLVAELCSGENLLVHMLQHMSFTERDASSLMRQLLSAVSYLHEKGLIHRDLRPEILVLDSPKLDANLKIVEFSSGRWLIEEERLKSKKGSAQYMAPEMVKGSYTSKCDLWSCGVILFSLLSGSLPFTGMNDTEILQKVEKGKWSLSSPVWKEVSSGAKLLLKGLLEINPERRLSAEKALKDPWLNSTQKSEPQLSPLVLENFRTFNCKNKIQQAFCLYIAHQLTTKQETNDLLQTFKALDANNDGRISRDELTRAYKDAEDASFNIDIDSLMANLDADCDGFIEYSGKLRSYAEFIAGAINSEKLLTVDRIKNCFSAFDKDGNGLISLKELRNMFDEDRRMTKDMWKKLLKDIDTNQDGFIELKELQDLLTKLDQ